MENWTCSKCRALNPPRRNKCWQCGISRPHHIASIIESTQPTSTVKRIVPKKQKPRSKKASPTVTVAIIGLIGTLITALAASPVLIAFIQMTPIPSPSPNSSPTITAAITPILPTETPSLSPLRLTASYHIIDTSLSKCGAVLMPEYMNPNSDPAYVIENMDKLYEPEYFSENQLGGALAEIRVTSVAPTEWIQISSKVFAEIVNYEPLPGPLDAFSMGCGGQGSYEESSGVSVKEPVSVKEFEGILLGVDFLTLQPGEFEVILVPISADEPGRYEIRLGVEYVYQDMTSKVWSSETIFLSAPNKFRIWDWGDGGAVLNATGKFENGQWVSENVR